jgi:hypothetical protein
MGTGIRVALAVIVVVLSGVVLGQNTTAKAATTIRITGRVNDATGLPLPRATVTVAFVGSEKPATTVLTDDHGDFVFPAVSSQPYEMRFEKQGFKSSTMRLAQTKMDIIDVGIVVMEIGEVTEGPMFPIKSPGKRGSANIPLTVCEALRNLKHLNGKMVSVRGAFHFTHRHGGWLLDQRLNGDPCANMSRKSRIWWSALWLGSVGDPKLEGGPVDFEEERPTYSDLIQRIDDLEQKTKNQTFTVTLIGEIRTKKDLTIVPAPSGRGDVMGNGYGVGGAYAAMLIVKTARDIVPGDVKTSDRQR